MRSSLWIPAVAPSVVGVFFMVFSSSVLAQITPDGTLGSEGSIVLPNQVVKDLPADLIQGGAVRGSNQIQTIKERANRLIKEANKHDTYAIMIAQLLYIIEQYEKQLTST